ncbi:MAG: hypothetical protein GQ574_15205 [Crocinitomix sp.]|nr:hypothetical protein [Crocinitomix sp.]
METFLKEKIELIYQSHPDNLKDVSIIIPNKRASVYIQNYLAQQKGAAQFSPEILTINEWVDQNTSEKIISQIELLFILFEIHCVIEKDEAEDFNSFIKWGKIILSDFDEIDRYLIPPKLIFRDLRNIKDIENWSFLEEELSGGQEKYLSLWDKLPEYYQKLNEELEKRQVLYQGAAYKNFYDQLINPDIDSNLAAHYYFIGFNALSNSEEQILNYLRREKLADVFFDIDESYFENREHEAGHFYRKIINRWGLKKELGNHFNAQPKHIEVIETAQQIAQTKIAGSIIENLVAENANMDQTAIVLADESLLIPLTRSLPETIERANITMGYPLKFSHLKGLIDIVFDLQFNFQKFNSTRIYHKSLLNYLDHPYLVELIGDQSRLIDFENEIVKKNKIFIHREELMQIFPELNAIGHLFEVWKTPLRNGFVAFNELTRALYEALKNAESDRQIDLEIVYHFARGFKKFEAIALQYPHQLNLKSFKVLFYQFWQSESLSFLGNPIEGLQVMGILETRTLDFENLIILGMNEGNLPKTNVVNSFIPRDLKLNHGLPVEEDRQAIFAHHFYRLLHRSKNIYFTYNSTTDGVGASEKSRFITQLENELNLELGHKMDFFTYTSDDRAAEISDLRYSSTLAVQLKLDDRLANGLSPSALNKLVACPLDFYYRYVLGMKENVTVEENIESSTFGTKIHNVLEDIFRRNFLDKKTKLDAQVLEGERKNIEKYLKAAYLQDFSENDIKYGQNKLSFDVSLGFVDRFLAKQIVEIKKTQDPIFIIDLEKTLSATYQWEINGEMKTIKIEGNADRIEQFGSHYRIIDYKSGKCNFDKISLGAKVLEKEGMQTLMQHDKKGYGRQLLMYALMFRATYPEYHNFSAGIISMVNVDEWLQNVIPKKGDSEILSHDILDAFEEELRHTIEELYNEDFFFEHNSKALYCEHCDV